MHTNVAWFFLYSEACHSVNLSVKVLGNYLLVCCSLILIVYQCSLVQLLHFMHDGKRKTCYKDVEITMQLDFSSRVRMESK